MDGHAGEPSVGEVRDRLERAGHLIRDASWDAVLITPGPDLRYLVGYDAVALERLTCLIVPGEGPPALVVPLLEKAAAMATPLGNAGIDVVTWSETEDPYSIVSGLVPGCRTVGVDDHMWAVKALALREAMPQAKQYAAGRILSPLRMRKSAEEVSALHRAARAIDSVHAAVPELLAPGRTEREVGRDIAALILEAGHTRTDFVIVASGPHSASPHHEVSDRVLQPGDPVVVDIGGTMPDGYCSDETRTYALGDPGADYLRAYDALHAAQRDACNAVRPGVTCEEIDAVARQRLASDGLADLFIHRTGHGIGLETHEEPYIVAGNTMPLAPGMAFSVEPGFYAEGRWGARIEDIVVCGETGPLVLNDRPRDLMVVE
jgi:Xaa-Pro aminopeptidase